MRSYDGQLTNIELEGLGTAVQHLRPSPAYSQNYALSLLKAIIEGRVYPVGGFKEALDDFDIDYSSLVAKNLNVVSGMRTNVANATNSSSLKVKKVDDATVIVSC